MGRRRERTRTWEPRCAVWLRATPLLGANISHGLSMCTTHCPVQLLACPLSSAPWPISRPCSPLRWKTSVPSVQHHLRCCRRLWRVCCALLSRTGVSVTVAEFPLLPIEWVRKCAFPQGTPLFRLALRNEPLALWVPSLLMPSSSRLP